MRRQITFLTLLFFVIFTAAAFAAPLFPDVPEKHWARDAVADLAAKGILEGYPDGTFKGDRATTRWEMALMIERLLSKMEAEHANFATKADLEALRAIVNELKDELESLGARTTVVEQAYNNLDNRTTELERIRFYGYVEGIHNFFGVSGNLANAGANLNPVYDWTNGRLIVRGNGSSFLAKLGTKVRASELSSFGIEFAGYSAIDNSIINMYWGVTPPYLSNPFTTFGSANPFMQPKNNTPWTRITFDRFWYRYEPLDLTLTTGAYLNEKIDRLVLFGERNPNINCPEILPFYGLNLKSRFNKCSDNWSYELSYTQLPQASLFMTHMVNGTVMYRDKKTLARIHGLNVNNRTANGGIIYQPGSAVAPTLPSYPMAPGNMVVYWQNRFGAINNPKLGVQAMKIGGIDVEHALSPNWTIFAKAAFSAYDPDATKTIYNTTANGSALTAGISANYCQIDGRITYVYTTNNYDPFILQYPGPGSGIPVFLPYSTYYSNYYQLHDYLSYPTNRNGLRLCVGYNFTPRTRLEAQADYLRQTKASTFTNFTTVGNIEPLFPYLQTPGSTVKGNVSDWGVKLRHDFSNNFTGQVGYYNYIQKRATFAIDDINLKDEILYANLKYCLSPTFTLFGNYYFLNYRGHTGLANASFKQHVPSLTASARINDCTCVDVTYRHYVYRDQLNSALNWNANTWTIDWRMNF